LRLTQLGLGCLCLGLLGCDFAVPEPDAAAWQLHSVPADGDVDVPRAGRLVVSLDRLIVPQSAASAGVRLRSGRVNVPLTFRVQPVERELWLDVDPRTPLDPQVSYELKVDGLLDLDGAPQPEPYQITFQTGTALGHAAADPSPDVPEILGLFAQRCAQRACHGDDAPASGVNLASARGIQTTAIGQRSHTPAGTTGEEGVRGSRWLTGLRVVDVVAGRGDPATSQLIYKLLGDPHVYGAPMPPGGTPLSRRQLLAVSAWISAGAPLQ
jgi:hypothetical protein